MPKTSNIAPWLATTPGAEQALATLEENGKDRSRILSLLELLRLEHQGFLPTKTEVRQAIQAFKKAKKHVLGVARSMHSATDRFLISSGPLGDRAVSLVGGLRSLEELEAGMPTPVREAKSPENSATTEPSRSARSTCSSWGLGKLIDGRTQPSLSLCVTLTSWSCRR